MKQENLCFFLLAGHLFRHAGARSAQQAAAPPPLRQGEINFPAAHPTSLTAAVQRYGGSDGVAAAVVGRTVPRNNVSPHLPISPPPLPPWSRCNRIDEQVLVTSMRLEKALQMVKGT